MAYSEDYRELIDNAHDALRELLKRSEPDSWIQLRSGYSEIRRAQKHDDGLIERLSKRTEEEGQTKRRRSLEEFHAEWNAARAGWVPLSKHARERLVIELIGEGRLTTRQVIDQLKRQHDTSWLNYGDVYPTFKDLLAKGELDREHVAQGKRTVWAYFRKDMSGPIAELERLYHEDDEAA